MRPIFAYLILFGLLILGILAFSLLRRRLLEIPLVSRFVYNPSWYWFYVGYYLLIITYIISLFIPISGTPSEIEGFRIFRFVLSIIVAISSIIYGVIWLFQLIYGPF